MLLRAVAALSLAVILAGYLEAKGVQMQRDVQCCMQYSQGKIRAKDVLKFEVQTEGPDCSIQALILYTKRAVKCADPRDRKVKRLLRKLMHRQRTKARSTLWFHTHGNLPAMATAVSNSHTHHTGKVKGNWPLEGRENANSDQ